MFDLQEIGAVWRGELSRATKSGRIVALLVLYLVFTTLALGLAGAANVKLNEQFGGDAAKAAGLTPELAKEQMLAAKKGVLDFVYDEPWVSTFAPLPLVLLFVFKLAMVFVPLFVALMAFDVVSGDVGPRTIRYYVVRVRRSSLLAGKFLSLATLYAWLVATCVVVMTFVAKILNPEFSMADTASWGLKLVLASVVYGLAYLGLTTLCSSMVRTSAVSLIIYVILLVVFWVVNFVATTFLVLPGDSTGTGPFSDLRSSTWWAALRYLSIWQYENDLLHTDWVLALSSVLAHVGFAALCVGAGMVILQKRDV